MHVLETGQGNWRLRAAAGLAVVAAATASAGCGVSSSSGGSNGSSALRIVVPAEPPNLEPCDSDLTAQGLIERGNITEELVRRDPASGELKPWLSSGWKQTASTTWTFTIRSGVKFSDGKPFDAQAAAFSINRALTKSLACDVNGYIFSGAQVSAKALNPTTLQVTTQHPDPILPLRISFVQIVSPSTSMTKKTRSPIGTGPYELAKWSAGTSIELKRNQDYWGAKPDYSQVRYQWRSAGSVRASMLKTGEADVAASLAPTDGAGKYGVTYPSEQTAALRFDGRMAPLNDIRVRQAINYAIDRAGLIKAVLPGFATPAAQLVPASAAGFNPSLTPWPYDLAKAKSLVAAAKADGVPVDKTITVIERSGMFPAIDGIAQAMQHAMEQAGLHAKVRTVDTATSLQFQLRPFVSDQGPTALIVEHGNQAGDAQFTIDQYYLSDAYQSTFGTAKEDKLVHQADAASGPEREAAMHKALANENSDVVGYAFIAHMKGLIGLRSNVSYKPNPSTDDEMLLSAFKRSGK